MGDYENYEVALAAGRVLVAEGRLAGAQHRAELFSRDSGDSFDRAEPEAGEEVSAVRALVLLDGYREDVARAREELANVLERTGRTLVQVSEDL